MNRGDSFKKIRAELYAIKEEIRNDVSGPVIASFGFIIALVWRDAIKGALDHYLQQMGLLEKAYLYNFISAVIITIFVIIIMVSVTKLSRAKRRKRIKKEMRSIEKELKEK